MLHVNPIKDHGYENYGILEINGDIHIFIVGDVNSLAAENHVTEGVLGVSFADKSSGK